MLGEDHSLLHDFPHYKESILSLLKNDTAFSKENEQYNQLDKEIRKLELLDSPISDEDMHQLKHQRSELKDRLFQRLTVA